MDASVFGCEGKGREKGGQAGVEGHGPRKAEVQGEGEEGVSTRKGRDEAGRGGKEEASSTDLTRLSETAEITRWA